MPANATKHSNAKFSRLGSGSRFALSDNATKKMPMYYFHLSNDQKVPDTDGTDLADLAAARSHAFVVARELMSESQGMLDDDWSLWRMSVRDSADTELFSFSFSDLATGNGK
jgi:hypothetical protein